jgi:hypothetical protein
MSLNFILFLTTCFDPTQGHLYATQGTHDRGSDTHKEAQRRRNTKTEKEHSQNTKIENTEDVHQQVLLTCEHSAVGSIKMCCHLN